jgi:hypothetical protein
MFVNHIALLPTLAKITDTYARSLDILWRFAITMKSRDLLLVPMVGEMYADALSCCCDAVAVCGQTLRVLSAGGDSSIADRNIRSTTTSCRHGSIFETHVSDVHNTEVAERAGEVARASRGATPPSAGVSAYEPAAYQTTSRHATSRLKSCIKYNNVGHVSFYAFYNKQKDPLNHWIFQEDRRGRKN